MAEMTQTGSTAPNPEQISDLVAANRILASHGILDAFGHVSIRHPGRPDHYLMSRWLAPALVTAEDIVEYDLESVALTHQGMQLYSERYIHSEIYKVRPDVHAIVHSHSPTVVPFSVTRATFRPILHNAAFLGTDVPVFDIREKFGPTDMLVNRKERGTEVARVLGKHNVALMRGHGNVVVGSNIQNVVWRAYYTEVNARMLATAVALGGGPIEYLSAEETELTDVSMQRVEARPWKLWKEKALGGGS